MNNPKINIYRGRDGNINYNTVVAEMAIGAARVSIPDQDLPVNTVWHFVRRQTSPCGLESGSSLVCVVIINSDGNMGGQTPNKPVHQTIEQLAGGKFRLRWRYFPQGQEVRPTGFKIYMDSGTGFDFDSPLATIAYTGETEHSWQSAALTHGQRYKFIIRSYYRRSGVSSNTDIVSAVADSQGPVAVADASISYAEVVE